MMRALLDILDILGETRGQRCFALLLIAVGVALWLASGLLR